MIKNQAVKNYLFSLQKLQKKHVALLRNLKKRMSKLEELLKTVEDHWGYEDLVYRYYHTSDKMYAVQGLTLKIVEILTSVSPHKDKDDLEGYFWEIINDGIGYKHELFHNEEWSARGWQPLTENLQKSTNT